MGVGAGLSMYVVVVQKFTFAISSPDEFLFYIPSVAVSHETRQEVNLQKHLRNCQCHAIFGRPAYSRCEVLTLYFRPVVFS